MRRPADAVFDLVIGPIIVFGCGAMIGGLWLRSIVKDRLFRRKA